MPRTKSFPVDNISPVNITTVGPCAVVTIVENNQVGNDNFIAGAFAGDAQVGFPGGERRVFRNTSGKEWPPNTKVGTIQMQNAVSTSFSQLEDIE